MEGIQPINTETTVKGPTVELRIHKRNRYTGYLVIIGIRLNRIFSYISHTTTA